MPTDGAESVNTPRRGSHRREWKQITGSEGGRNSHQAPSQEPALPSRPRETRGEQCGAINQQGPRQRIHKPCDRRVRSTGVRRPERLRPGADTVDAALISATHYKGAQAFPSNSSLLAFTKFFSTDSDFAALPRTHAVRKC